MKIYLILLLTCISAINNFNSPKFKKPIDYRFENGENGYISFFSENIGYPIPAMENGIVGNSITRISINPKGKIDSITIINPIDSLVDNEVLRVIDLSKSLWKKCDTVNHDQVFYIQIAFSTPSFQPNLCRPKSEEIIKLFPEPILIIISKVDDFKKPFLKSQELSERANSCLDSGKFEEALPFINELIKRDPFNRDLYKVRIMINIKLNRLELVDQDDNKINNFAEEFSIDDLNKDQD
jgi:hypothetical protein